MNANVQTIELSAGEVRPAPAVSTGIGNKKLFRIVFFSTLVSTTSAWIAFLGWLGKYIFSLIG